MKVGRITRVAILACLTLIAGALGFLLLRDNSPEAIVAERLRAALKAKGYFALDEAGVPDVVFYCVCGPYRVCETLAQNFAKPLAYSVPVHDFITGISRIRQMVFFFQPGKVFAVELPSEYPLIAQEHEGYCGPVTDRIPVDARRGR